MRIGYSRLVDPFLAVSHKEYLQTDRAPKVFALGIVSEPVPRPDGLLDLSLTSYYWLAPI